MLKCLDRIVFLLIIWYIKLCGMGKCRGYIFYLGFLWLVMRLFEFGLIRNDRIFGLCMGYYKFNLLSFGEG